MIVVVTPYPIVGQFYTYVPMKFVVASTIFVELLGVDLGIVTSEMKHCQGAHIKLN